MKAQCPHCGFTGNIRDDLVPEAGRTIACPKCKNTFFVRRDDTGSDQPGQAPTQAAARPRPARKAPNPQRMILLGFLLILLGFLGGYYYRGYVERPASPPAKIEKPGKGPKKHPIKPGPKHGRGPIPTPTAAVPPGGPGGPSKLTPGESFTTDALLADLAAMPPGQAKNFCRKNSAAEVTGSGKIRELKKTGTAGGIIATYSITIDIGPDARVVVGAKMTESYVGNFAVGNAVGFVGNLSDYAVSGKSRTIYLEDGMIVVH